MKKFVCTKCGEAWYSAANNNKPCEKCGGRLIEVEKRKVNKKGIWIIGLKSI